MSTHHGYIKEFSFIRCDSFSNHPNPYSATNNQPQFYLLTHAHTDHFVGLDSPQFHGEIYCSAVTKHLVLNTIECGHRVNFIRDSRYGKKRKFANLRSKDGSARPSTSKTGQDRMRELQINKPTVIQGAHSQVTITALDANHCPGSCMFLIEGIVDGVFRSVLITGDIRAEPWWVTALSRNPIISRYLAHPVLKSSSSAGIGDGFKLKGKGKEKVSADDPRDRERYPTLDCIYLDTSAVVLDEELIDKSEAVQELVTFMALYPSDTKFFLNSWTWGYEDMLKAVARAFNTSIHLDWYKLKIYHSRAIKAVDPLLSSLGTDDERGTRFHACERRWKCDQVWADGRGCYDPRELDGDDSDDGALLDDDLDWKEKKRAMLRMEEKRNGPTREKAKAKAAITNENKGKDKERVVYVNPSEMPRRMWDSYKRFFRNRVEVAEVRRLEGRGEVEVVDDERSEGLPNYLIVPLARHSTYPELHSFVSLFQPRTLYPLVNDEDSRNPCRIYKSLGSLFRDALSPGGADRVNREAQERFDFLMKDRWGMGAGRNEGRDHPTSSRTVGTNPVDRELGDREWFREFAEAGGRAGLEMNVEGGEDIVQSITKWRTYVARKEAEWEREEEEEEEEDRELQTKRKRCRMIHEEGGLHLAAGTAGCPRSETSSAIPASSPPSTLSTASLSRRPSETTALWEDRHPQLRGLTSCPSLSPIRILVPPTPTSSGLLLSPPKLAPPPPVQPPVSVTSFASASCHCRSSTSILKGPSHGVKVTASQRKPHLSVSFVSPCAATPSTGSAGRRGDPSPSLVSPELFVQDEPSSSPPCDNSGQFDDPLDEVRLDKGYLKSLEVREETKENLCVITARPSKETREQRRTVMANLVRQMGGRIAQGGKIIPIKKGDPLWDRVRGRPGTAESKMCEVE
ncbi:hypothetical protein T439DRAFT_204649 [Meredithblackwellia eburnea MCA 4105]